MHIERSLCSVNLFTNVGPGTEEWMLLMFDSGKDPKMKSEKSNLSEQLVARIESRWRIIFTGKFENSTSKK